MMSKDPVNSPPEKPVGPSGESEKSPVGSDVGEKAGPLPENLPQRRPVTEAAISQAENPSAEALCAPRGSGGFQPTLPPEGSPPGHPSPPAESHESPPGESLSADAGKSVSPQEGSDPSEVGGESRPRRRILIGSQRDPAQYRRRFFGESVRLLGFRRDRGERRHPQEPREKGPGSESEQVSPLHAESPASSEEKDLSSARTVDTPGEALLPPGAFAVSEPAVEPPLAGVTPEAGSPSTKEGQSAVEARPLVDSPAAGMQAPSGTSTSALPPEVSTILPGIALDADTTQMGTIHPPFAETGLAGARELPEVEPEPSISEPLQQAEAPVAPLGFSESFPKEEVPGHAGVAPALESSPSPGETLMWHAIAESLPELRVEIPENIAQASVPLPTIPKPTDKLSADLVSELEEALAGFSMDQALQGVEHMPRERIPEDTLLEARVVGIHEDKVFVDLGVREQGYFSLKETEDPPEIGKTLQVRVVRFDPENSIYEVALPARAAEVAAWDELTVGMLVEARVTGVNAGGLECEVNHIRGFIPLSHIAPYRVTNPEEYVGQRLTCVVIEANRERRNLVLSRRAAIEREQEAAREALWAQLEPGQVVEGLVRKLMDFGAFVDLGGVDGLLHISQISWGRIHHPSQVLQEGQRIKVKILSVDRSSKRISLAYRDLAGDPWEQVTTKYPENSVIRGRVTRIMPYGAFVELEPGVEGLVHISELAWKKVWRVSDVVKEGQEVDVVVMSVDPQARRISLSMKHLSPPPEEMPPQEEETPTTESSAQAVSTPSAGEESAAAGEAPAESPPEKPKKPPKPERPLRGGLGPSPLGKKFGLNW